MIAKLATRLIAFTLFIASLNTVAPAAELAIGNAALVLSMTDGDDRPGGEERRPAIATAVTVSPDGALIAAGGDDHRVRVWDAKTGQPIATLEGHEDWVRGLHLSPAGDRLASVGNDGALRFWNPQTGAAVSKSRPLARGPLSSVAFHPDGRRVLTVGFRTPLRVFDLDDPRVANDYPCACEDTRCVAVSRDGRRAAAAGRNGRLRVWDMETMQTLPDVPADRQRIYSVAFSPDGRTIVTGGDSRVIRFWNAEDGELLAELPTRGVKVRSMLFLDGEQLVVGGVDNSINVWSISSRLPTRRLVGHTGSVAALARDASGRVLASASYDTTVRVWRLDERAEETASRDAPKVR